MSRRKTDLIVSALGNLEAVAVALDEEIKAHGGMSLAAALVALGRPDKQSEMSAIAALLAKVSPPPPAPRIPIHINSDVPIEYPATYGYYKKPTTLIHPELENLGPSRYDLARDVHLWRHELQTSGNKCCNSSIVYDYLEEHGLLGHCLGFADGLALVSRGLSWSEIQEALDYKGGRIFLWRSAMKVDDSEPVIAPYIGCHNDSDEPDIHFSSYHSWEDDGPAAMFASGPE